MEQRKKSDRRKFDIQNSNIITEWLEENLYNKYTTDYIRITDRENQIKGIDSMFKYKDVNYKCDEKAAVDYINSKYPLKTFAFELSFININNERQDGWLLNKDIVTDIYGLIWPKKAKRLPLESIDDIEEIDYAFVKKSSILNYLGMLGWTLDKLAAKENMIRRMEGKTEMGDLNKHGCKFSYTPREKKVENPINVLIPKDILMDMSIF